MDGQERGVWWRIDTVGDGWVCDKGRPLGRVQAGGIEETPNGSGSAPTSPRAPF